MHHSEFAKHVSNFGRTVYSQGILADKNYDRDNHPRCFSIWMVGGAIKGVEIHGETFEMSYNITQKPVHIRDLHATILYALGIHHELTVIFGLFVVNA
jgi:hypothetical protein